MFTRRQTRRRDCSWIFRTPGPDWPRSLGPFVGSAASSSPPRNTRRWSRACSSVPIFWTASRCPVAVRRATRWTAPVSRRHRRGRSRGRRRPDNDVRTARRGGRLRWTEMSRADRRLRRGSCRCCRRCSRRWNSARPVGASVRKSVDDDGPTATSRLRSGVLQAAAWRSRGLRSAVSCTISAAGTRVAFSCRNHRRLVPTAVSVVLLHRSFLKACHIIIIVMCYMTICCYNILLFTIY